MQEKQRAKVKGRLDKHVKDVLLGLCDFLDITVSKANSKKAGGHHSEATGFIAAPHSTTDSLFAEKEQDSPKSLKGKRVARGSASKSTYDVVQKKSRKVKKRATGGKPKSGGAGQYDPSKEELGKTICKILEKVDFNTATFTDILRQLAKLYRLDLTPRKATIKLMIQEELTLLADVAEDDVGSKKEEHPKAEGKKVEV